MQVPSNSKFPWKKALSFARHFKFGTSTHINPRCPHWPSRRRWSGKNGQGDCGVIWYPWHQPSWRSVLSHHFYNTSLTKMCIPRKQKKRVHFGINFFLWWERLQVVRAQNQQRLQVHRSETGRIRRAHYRLRPAAKTMACYNCKSDSLTSMTRSKRNGVCPRAFPCTSFNSLLSCSAWSAMKARRLVPAVNFSNSNFKRLWRHWGIFAFSLWKLALHSHEVLQKEISGLC